MNLLAETVGFKQTYRKTENYVPCAYCGTTIYRTAYRRNRNLNSFCCISHRNLFYKGVVRNHVFGVEYKQRAFGVSPEIAQALKTGEYP